MLRTEWFDEWFDSPYYHILYKNRDKEEAQHFIDRLSSFLHFSVNDKILDLACGKGRHAIYLNKKGYDVVGLDLSSQSIEYASQFENERLKFFVHDMRNIWAHDQFDYVLNLFTSFGYFDSEEENQEAISACAACLKQGGKLLIDFLNPYTVVHNLVPEETKEIDGISFNIRKYLSEDGFIVKNINFKIGEETFDFQERVKAIRRAMFMKYFETAGFELLNIFGDYDLSEYIPEKSERMIFLLKNNK